MLKNSQCLGNRIRFVAEKVPDLLERPGLAVELLDDAAERALGGRHPGLRAQDLQAGVQLLVVHGQVVQAQDAGEALVGVLQQLVLAHQQLGEVEQDLRKQTFFTKKLAKWFNSRCFSGWTTYVAKSSSPDWTSS